MNRTFASIAISLGMCSMLAPMPASAQTSDKWEFGAIVYGWLPTIGGKTTFPAGTGSTIDVDADTLLDHLKFTFMGSFEARKDRWGVFTDIIYLDVGGSKSQTRDVNIGGKPLPGGITADLNLDLKSTIWTIAGEYRVATDRTANVDVLAGARSINVKPSLGWNFSADLGPLNPSRTGSSEISETKWDAIVGAKGRLYFGDNKEWFAPWYLDVGTGQTDLTWQAIGGIGYAFTWGEVIAVWRYMDYNFKSGEPIENLNLNGPAIGVAFHWQ
jgi:hypothetical protein